MSSLLGTIDRVRRAREMEDHLEEEDSTPFGGGDGNLDAPHPRTETGSDDVPSSAYLLDWSGTTCEKTNLTPQEFRNAIPTTSSDSISMPAAWVKKRRARLLVLRGLPAEYVKILLTSESQKMDPAFINAHARRRCYRPMGKGQAQTYETWEYPELVQGFDTATAPCPQRGENATDGMKSPEIRLLGKGGFSALFCHASLWVVSNSTSVLLLDRPVSGDPLSGLRKASWGPPAAIQAEGNTADGDDRIPSLEETLISTLKGKLGSDEDFPDGAMLAGIVFNKWLDLFDALEAPTSHRGSHETLGACYWRMLHSLEQNQNAVYASQRRRSQRRDLSQHFEYDWSGLLTRISQRISLLSIPPAKRPGLTSTGTNLTGASVVTRTPSGSKKFSPTGTLRGTGTLPPGRTPGRDGRDVLDENHRALDRISYLGGILIPLPIVSSILSMGDVFGPDGPKFFVFWAASIPLSILAVLVIYADTIRRAEVWVEVAVEHVSVLSTSGDAEDVVEDSGGEKWCGLWQRRDKGGQKGDEEAQVPPKNAEMQTRILGVPPEVTAPPKEKEDEEVTDADMEPEVVSPMPFSMGHGLVGVEPPQEIPEVILETPIDGRKPKAWKRKKLGWGGAAKVILYQKPRYCDKDIPQGVAAYEKQRRKTKTL